MTDAETPTASLADRLDRFRIVTMADGDRSIVMTPVSDEDRTAAAAQLRQLDRIKAAAGDDIEWSVALAVCRELAVRYPSWASDLNITEALLRRLDDALEADDGA